MEKEIWKPVVGFEGAYEVSSLGKLKRIADACGTHTGRIVRCSVVRRGYIRTALSYKSKITWQFVHRIVAMAFIPNPENKPCVNHIDCCPSNNKVSNLEWVTYRENTTHAQENNRIIVGEQCTFTKLKSSDILLIRSSSLSVEELAEKFGVHPQTIKKVISKKTWKHII